MRLYGQTFTTGIIDRIRLAVSECAELTRSGLSRQVCEWLDWRGPSGKPKEVSCRKALLDLERRGLIELPAAQCLPPQARTAAPRAPWNGPRFEGSLESLGRVELVGVAGRGELSAVWRAMMERYHPQGGGPLCGAQQRYLIHSPRAGWLGGLAFSAAAWHLAARDVRIGWCAHARRANLPRVVANSRFLLLPEVVVPNLGSHVLGLAARRLPADWAMRYGLEPWLLETFVDEARFAGTVYRAANWQRLGETAGRGRQDRHPRAAEGRKAVYVLPLHSDWRSLLCHVPTPALRKAEPQTAPSDWVEHEFGAVDLPDGRLRPRLRDLAEAFFDHPNETLAEALGGDWARNRAAYRFFKNPQVNLHNLLHGHYEATLGRIDEQPRVLVVQDTTSLNYTAHPSTEGLGPINTRADGASGLKLHDTLALTPEGVPLGLVDIQVWARDPLAIGQAAPRKERPIEEKESQRWLNSYRRTAEFQRLCSASRLINVADREADIFELFQEQNRTPDGPDLLIRASRTARRQVQDDDEIQSLWDYVPARPSAGGLRLSIPRRGGHKARVARLEVRHTPIQLRPPKRLAGADPIGLWAVHAVEPEPPPGCEPVEWLLLTSVPTVDLEDAFERLAWYAARWNIEVYHRTLKSGCRIEDRRLADAKSLEACLALDLVVAWRVMHLAKLGRETPDVPCTVFFEEEEWQALCCYHQRTPTPPENPPSLGEAMRMVAKLGGFLGRTGDGHPGATYLWRGLDHLAFISDTFRIFHPAIPRGP